MRRRAFLRTVAAVAGAAALLAAAPGWAQQEEKDKGGDGAKNGKGGKNGEKDPPKDGGKDGEKGAKGGEKGPKDPDKPREKDPEKPKEKDPKDAPEWKACEAIGAEFAGKKSKALAARVRPGGKLDLKLGETSGRYAADQAAEVLDGWFKTKGEMTVKLRSVKDLLGSFDLTVRRAGTDREVKHQLLVEIQKREKGEGFHLVRLEKV